MIGAEAPTDSDSNPVSNRAESIISMMAHPDKIFFTGKLGTGLGAKIAHNYIAITLILATAEGMAMGLRTGVEPKTLHDIVRASSGNSWHIDVNPCIPDVVPTTPSSNGFKLAFGSNMAVKNLSLGIETAYNTRVEPQ
jgi:3-hydroxyisobutyrate dehydrogenase-like beta-hydroxyacid dehydrogenase